MSEAMNTKVKIVKCPSCKADVPWGPQSPYRPFCSERCKLIDMGAWASESYRVAGNEHEDALPEGDEE